MKKILYLSPIVLLFLACNQENVDKKNDKPAALVLAANYDDSGYNEATNYENGLRTNLKALVDEIKKGRVATNKVSAATLKALYYDSNPNLKDMTTAVFNANINFYFDKIAESSGNEYSPREGVHSTGGVYGGYLFDKYGLEYEQLVEKGLFSALMYNHATHISKGTLDKNAIHKLVAISGANPTFPNTDKAVGAAASGGGTHVGAAKPDAFSAAYMARRDKNDGNGFYSQFKKNALKAQAALVAGSKYDDTLKAAVKQMLTIWEKSLAATVINYSISARNNFSKTNPTDAELSSALHAYGEGVGFTLGFKGIPQEHKIITDTQIDEILALLLAPIGQNSQSYKFVTEPATVVGNFNAIIDKLKLIYGFSDADIADFSKNWVNEQKR